jgi:membrane-bound lytic murein transglycosylase MltF
VHLRNLKEDIMQQQDWLSRGKWIGLGLGGLALVIVLAVVFPSGEDGNGQMKKSAVSVPTAESDEESVVVTTEESEPAEQSGEPAAQSDSPATGSEDEALIELATKLWTGDLDAMLERGFIRVLTAYNPLFFHYDGVEQRGLVHDGMEAFAAQLHKTQPKGQPPVRVLIIPLARDELLPGLVEGRGDIVTANLTITPERQKTVQFTDPTYPDVSELLITGPAAAQVTSLDDLGDTPVHIRESSSYFEHLLVLNEERKSAGLAEIRIKKADERLEDYDLLEMVNAGILPAVIVDSHKAALWAQVFDKIKVHENVATHEGGNIAWAIRKDSPKLLEAANAFLETARKGTTLGNILLNRYVGDTAWIDNALTGAGWERYEDVVEIIKKYAGEYDFDWLIITAQGYQESKLDQSKVSPAGAVGIMQILPATAADPNVGIPDIQNPENNVEAGVKYLRFLRERYFTDPAIDAVNQVLFSFAAYNAGPANIAKAREKAREMSLDPNRWFGNVEVAAARTISREPVIYVRNIYKYYVAYKLHEESKAARDAAKQAAE